MEVKSIQSIFQGNNSREIRAWMENDDRIPSFEVEMNFSDFTTEIRKNIYKDINNNFHIDVEVTGYENSQLKVVTKGSVVTVLFSKDHNLEFVNDFEEEIVPVKMEIPIVDKKFEYGIPSSHDASSLTVKNEYGLLKLKFAPTKEIQYNF